MEARQKGWSDSERGWRRGFLTREWRWDHWEGAEVFPEILRENLILMGEGQACRVQRLPKETDLFWHCRTFSGTRVAGPSDYRKAGLSPGGEFNSFGV